MQWQKLKKSVSETIEPEPQKVNKCKVRRSREMFFDVK